MANKITKKDQEFYVAWVKDYLQKNNHEKLADLFDVHKVSPYAWIRKNTIPGPVCSCIDFIEGVYRLTSELKEEKVRSRVIMQQSIDQQKEIKAALTCLYKFARKE